MMRYEIIEPLWRMCDYVCGGEECPEKYEIDKAVNEFCNEYSPYEICTVVKSIYGLYLSKILYGNIEIPKDLQTVVRTQLWNFGLMVDLADKAEKEE